MGNTTALVAIKAVHTVVWAFFVGCILGIPVAAHLERWGISLALIGAVLVEVGVLLVYGWRCPLTGVAARYTEGRRGNFDIYLPLWLANHNKVIFGALFVGGSGYTAIRWLTSGGGP